MNVAAPTVTDDSTVSDSGSVMEGSSYSQDYSQSVFVTLRDVGRLEAKDGAALTPKTEILRISIYLAPSFGERLIS